jgi:hypothetical protein
MCLPAAAAIPLAIAATAVTAGGQILNGVGQSQQLRYQARTDETNARMAEGQAKDSIENTNLEARQYLRQKSQLQGQQTAAMAANGVDLSFGSAADVQRDTNMIASEDLYQLYKGGNERTKGFEINAFNYRSRAAGERSQAKNAMTQAIFGAVGTALGGASQVANMKGK